MSICQHRQTFLAHQGSAQGTRSPVDAAAPRKTLQDFLGVMRRSVESRPRRHRNQVASHPTLPSHLREKGENTQKLCPLPSVRDGGQRDRPPVHRGRRAGRCRSVGRRQDPTCSTSRAVSLGIQACRTYKLVAPELAHSDTCDLCCCCYMGVLTVITLRMIPK